jgi:hypothetical protein
MFINHQGIGTGGGLPFSLVAGLKTAVGQQATFTAYNKLAARTTVQGQVDLCGAAGKAVGVFVDCSPKGDSCTVETEGFEWILYSGTAPAVGDIVTPAADGLVALIADGAGIGATPTAAECFAGAWQVDMVDAVKGMVLINLGC